MFALTYDDGPDPVWTPRVLDALGAHGATATFFVLGSAVRRHPEPLLRAHAEGHEIALHGDHHLRHTELTRELLTLDTYRAVAALEALGIRPRRWRAPWGVATATTRALATQEDLELVEWSVDTHDWRGDSAGAMARACAPGPGAGDVVLMHDGIGPGARRADCDQTVALTERLLADTGLPAVSLAAMGRA